MRKFLTTSVLLLAAICAQAQNRSISGRIMEAGSDNPVIGAVVRIGDDYLWAVADAEGEFSFENVQQGKYDLEASCLGYMSITVEIDVNKDIEGLEIRLYENSLALDEVVVTAQKAKDGLGTTHSLGRDALNHLQLSNMTDVAALLPGGKTVNPDLTSENTFSIRDGGLANGNASFGTAVEVDGVRIGNNASFGEMQGIDTRSVAVENIESIEQHHSAARTCEAANKANEYTADDGLDQSAFWGAFFQLLPRFVDGL